MAEFILETSYLSRRIIRQTDLSKYKSEDEFCSIIFLDILRRLHDGCFGVEEPSCENIETSPSHVETSSKKLFMFSLDINLEMSYPSERRISLRQISLRNLS